MSDHILWDQSKARIPKEKYQEAVEDLCNILNIKEEDLKRLPLESKVKGLLYHAGFDSHATAENINLHGNHCNDIDDIWEERTLLFLTGIFSDRSFITGFSDGGTIWQLRYTEEERSLVYATVTFPKSDGKYLDEFYSG